MHFGFLAESIKSQSIVKSLLNGGAAQAKKTLMGTPIPEPLDDGATLALNLLKQEVKRSDKSVFGFANLMETHEPYSFFRGMDENLVDKKGWSSLHVDRWDLIYNECAKRDKVLMRQYHRATVEYVTRKIAELAEDLPNTTIIVTSDHGENLGYPEEDNLWGHTSSLSDALCHVPLDIINPPTNVGAVEKLVSHLDLPKIVQSLADGEIPEIDRAVAPAETLGMAAGPEPPADKDHWNRGIRAVWSDDQMVVWDSESNELPAWAQDEFDISIEKAKSNASDKDVSIDAATEARLEELGYI